MNCKKCGNLMKEAEIVCPVCGENNLQTNVNGVQMPQNNVGQPMNQYMNQVANPNVNGVQMPQNNMGQPVMPNVNGFQQNYNNQPVKKKKPLFMIIVIILVVVIGVMIGFVVIKNLNKTENPGGGSGVVDSVDNDNNSGDNNQNGFALNDFNFPVPTNYEASLVEGTLKLVDAQNNVMIGVTPMSGYVIEDVEEQKESFKKQYEEQGYNVKTATTKTYNGLGCVIFELGETTQKGTKYEVNDVFCELGSYHLAQTTIFNGGTKSIDNILNDMTGMYKNTTYKGTTNFATGNKEDNNSDLTIKIDSSILK